MAKCESRLVAVPVKPARSSVAVASANRNKAVPPGRRNKLHKMSCPVQLSKSKLSCQATIVFACHVSLDQCHLWTFGTRGFSALKGRQVLTT